LICSNDNFTILCTVFEQIGYDSTFDDVDVRNGVWTLFAPTNEAWTNLSDDMTEDILTSLENTEYVLLYHIVDDIKLTSDDLECTWLVRTANGKDTRTVCMNDDNNDNNNNKVYQKGGGNSDNMLPEIVEVDIQACNGIIHVVNQVILPKKLPHNHDDDDENDDDDHHEDDDYDGGKDQDTHDDYDDDDKQPAVYDKPAQTPSSSDINYPHAKPDHDYYPDKNKNKPTTPYPTKKPTNKPSYKPPTDAPSKAYKPPPPTAKPTFAYPEEDPNYVEDKPIGTTGGGVDGRQQQCDTISDIICNTDGFMLLCEAVKMVGLFDFLELSEWTLFAPNDEAFEKLVIQSQQEGQGQKLNPDNMSNLLFFHLVESSVLEFNDLICNKWLKMSNNGFTFTHCRGFDKYQVGRGNGFAKESVISIKDSPIILHENIIACNGIIHSIDTVMLPAWWA
jgi:uncharacterized surface protein with fasciclin (FAS1) repeats